MLFEKSNLKKRYWTYRNYLKARCTSIPAQLERRFKKCSVYHTASTCYGISNYIHVSKQDDNGDDIDSITIRISDHDPTGSGDPCDYYLYIDNKSWADIKKDIFDIATKFLQ